MDIALLEFYLRLFAIITNIFPQLKLENVKDFLKSSLLKELNPDLYIESLCILDEYHLQFSNLSRQENIQELWKTVNHMDDSIHKKQKFLILLRLLMFEKFLLKYSADNQELAFHEVINIVSGKLQVNNTLVQDCQNFIFQKYYQIVNIQNLLIVRDNNLFQVDVPVLHRAGFPGQLVFYYIEEQNLILFCYKGLQTLKYQNHHIYASSVYYFNKGSSISGDGFEPIFYNQVYLRFKVKEHVKLKMEVRNLEFRYKNSNHGIHKLNLDIESEQLIGIMGRSGAGKSTLINMLAGNKNPTKGYVRINGIDLSSNKLDGLIGYVSQDDLLIEDLSVFMNLYLNARLCFGDLKQEVLKTKVHNLLNELDLFGVKDLKVGSAINPRISGGQRKKLNIALELIREPWILFADEPTSGLSSSDSEEIMQLLAEQTKKSRIVVVNIHQPSSGIFKMFDKIIVLDREGYPVYFGRPMEAVPYFNDYYQKLLLNTDFCHICENVRPESIFKIIEEKQTNEFGEYVRLRKTQPSQWHKHYLLNYKVDPGDSHEEKLPGIQFNRPGPFIQFRTFVLRNFLAKIANIQYLLLALTISPVLAVVLSFLCRFGYTSDNPEKYIFAYNENIPSYLFMTVIVALFLGLIMSAEEIISDRKILLRESFLKLNKISYINSKITYLFAISALQSFLFVVIGHFILNIQGMIFSFWLMMFSVSCFANLAGLFISSVLKSVVAIYILVPLIIIPQMLLSGVVIKYDKINKLVAERENVPFVGDLMASRWAFEAIAVHQFAANDFQKYYFNTEQRESNIKYNLLFVIPELKMALKALESSTDKDLKTKKYHFLINELKKLDSSFNVNTRYKNRIPAKVLRDKIYRLNLSLAKELKAVTSEKDSITKSLLDQLGGAKEFVSFKNAHYNNSLADLVLKRKELEPYRINTGMVRLIEPVYKEPASGNGRAHFLSASKKVGNFIIPAYYFNLAMIWLMSGAIFLVLLLSFYFQVPFKRNYLVQIRQKGNRLFRSFDFFTKLNVNTTKRFMRSNVHKIGLVLFFLFTLGSLISQECKDFHKSAGCYVYVPLDRDFRIFNQAKSIQIETNKAFSYKIVLNGGKDYIVGVCSDPGYYRKIRLRILDGAGRNVLYDNSRHDFIESFGFSVEKTLALTMEVTVLADTNTDKKTCVGFQVLFSDPVAPDTNLK